MTNHSEWLRAETRPGRKTRFSPSGAGSWGPTLLGMALAAPMATAYGFDMRDLFAVSAGPVVLHPRFGFNASYSDNIYYLPDDAAIDDLFFLLSPGLNIGLGRPGGDNQLDFNFRFDQYLYHENTQADSSNYFFDLAAVAKGSRLRYDCRNSFNYLNSIINGYTSTIEGITTAAGNVERIYANLDHNLAYLLSPRTRLILEGSYGLRDYPSTEDLGRTYYNSEQWRARTGFGYELSSKIDLAARFYYGQTIRSLNESASPTASTPPRADLAGGTVTAQGQITRRLSGSVKAGYEHRWFSNDVDDGYPVVGISLSQRFRETTVLTLSYDHTGSVSSSRVLTTTGEEAFASATVRDTASLELRQTVGLRRPWFFNLRVTYALNDYVSTDQSLDNFELNFGVSHQLRSWLSIFANYSYEFGERSRSAGLASNDRDYAVNLFSVGLNLGL